MQIQSLFYFIDNFSDNNNKNETEKKMWHLCHLYNQLSSQTQLLKGNGSVTNLIPYKTIASFFTYVTMF